MSIETSNFEFDPLQEARNYREALIQEFSKALMGDVLEIGAGIGQITDQLAALPQINRVLAIEPEPAFCEQHQQFHPGHEVLQGTVQDVPPGNDWNAIVSINVLEHIENDTRELSLYADLLRARHGRLCLFVPARQEIYSPIDADFCHFRRYSKGGLKAKMEQAGFRLEKLAYFNFPGYFAWWLNFVVLKKRLFERSKVRFYDSWIFPPTHWIESTLLRPSIGQSVIAIGQIP